MALFIAGQKIVTDTEGFLKDREQWNDSVARALAQSHSLDLNAQHLQILRLMRQHFTAKEFKMSMRKVVAIIRENIGEQQASSLYLMQLFGSSPAKMIAKLAGLPKPKNCL